jgi:hypothetical protein
MRIPVQIGLVLASAAIATQGHAGGPDNPFSSDNAVASNLLDDYRGGFVTDNGLAVTLGIERIVTINGNLAERSELNLGDLGRLTSGQSTLSADTAAQVRLIQNGGGTFNVQMGDTALGGTVIQNSLNNQLINNQTIINASVNARGLLQAMNFQSSLANALNTAATGR